MTARLTAAASVGRVGDGHRALPAEAELAPGRVTGEVRSPDAPDQPGRGREQETRPAASVRPSSVTTTDVGPPPEVERRVAEPGREGVGALARERPDPTREPGLLAVDDGLEVDVAEARLDERPDLGDRHEGVIACS